jgi:hypothetical protein
VKGSPRLLLWVCVAFRVSASESGPTVALTYQRLEGAEACPDIDVIQQRIRERLGSDPFRDVAPLRLVLSVKRVQGRLLGTLEAVEAGAPPRRREMTSEKDDCEQIVEALSLAASLAIDPFAMGRPANAVPTPTPPVPSAPSPAPAPPPPASTRWVLDVATGAGGDFALSPAITVAFDAEMRARWASFSIGVGGRGAVPGTVTYGTSQVSGSLLVGEVAPCLHLVPVAGCATMSAGALRVSAIGVDRSQPQTTPFVGIGPRLQLELPSTSRFFARIRVELLAPLIRTTFLVDRAPVWIAPPLGGTATVAAGMRL